MILEFAAETVEVLKSCPADFAPRVFKARVLSEVPPSHSFPQPALVEHSEELRKRVRDMLRQGGFKPTGRSRPASESLVKALEQGRWPVIHPVVDLVNTVSLETGLPLSAVDLEKLSPPWTFRLGGPSENYVFNPSGQVLDLSGLLLACDNDGPFGSPVKDSQRSKISEATREVLIIIWSSLALAPEAEKAENRLFQLAASTKGMIPS